WTFSLGWGRMNLHSFKLVSGASGVERQPPRPPPNTPPRHRRIAVVRWFMAGLPRKGLAKQRVRFAHPAPGPGGTRMGPPRPRRHQPVYEQDYPLEVGREMGRRIPGVTSWDSGRSARGQLPSVAQRVKVW